MGRRGLMGSPGAPGLSGENGVKGSKVWSLQNHPRGNEKLFKLL